MSAVEDKSRAVAHYTKLAADVALLPATWPGLTGGPLRTLEQRRVNPRNVAKVLHKGITWTVHVEVDDGEAWIEAVQVDGQWVDAFECFCPAFLDDLQAAYRSAGA